MPGMDGLEATRVIRSKCPDARIIMLTQFDDPELREAAHAAGACGYVLKENLSEIGKIIGGDGDSTSRTEDQTT